MIPNPGFNELPKPKVPLRDISPELESANDPTFKDALDRKLEGLSDEKLFMMRKAHEVQLRVGYRDANIDEAIIKRTQEHMYLRGLTEESYEEFLAKELERE